MAANLDPIDRRIVEALYANGRLSMEQLAQAVGLARSSVHQRVRRLEAIGLITGYRAQIDWSKPCVSRGLPSPRSPGSPCLDQSLD